MVGYSKFTEEKQSLIDMAKNNEMEEAALGMIDLVNNTDLGFQHITEIFQENSKYPLIAVQHIP